MKQWNMAVTGVILVSLAMVSLVGCGDSSDLGAAPAETIFYPPAPDPPRLQFLTQITNLNANKSHSKSSFADFVVGAKIEQGEKIQSPYGVAARNGKIYVCDLAISNIYVIDVANNKFSMLGKRGVLKKPVNLTIAPDGTKYVADTGLNKVVIFDAQDRFVRYIGDSMRASPIDVALCKGELIVSNIKDNEIEAWSLDGKFLRKIATFGGGVTQLRMPTNLEVGPDGRIFVSETLNGIIKVYNNKGQYLGSVGAQGNRSGFFARPKGLAIDPKGILYVVDSQWEIVQMFDPAGRVLMVFGGAKPGLDGMGIPMGIAIDRTSIPAFKKYIDKDFQAEYLVFVANQHGPNKIGVYAFGKSKTADYNVKKPLTAAKPSAATQPAKTPE